MSFLGNIGRGLLGGAVGFLSGGPVGAAAGLVGGLSSGGQSGTASSSSTTSSVNMRPWDIKESTAYGGAMDSMIANGTPMSAADAEAYRTRMFNAIYNPAANAVNQAATTASATNYANAARRGAGANSTTKQEQTLIDSKKQAQLGDVASQATAQAEQAYMAEEANRRANMASAISELGQLWQQRLAGSSTTTSSSGTNTDTSPNPFWGTAAAGLATAVNDPNSYFNRHGVKLPFGLGTVGGKK